MVFLKVGPRSRRRAGDRRLRLTTSRAIVDRGPCTGASWRVTVIPWGWLGQPDDQSGQHRVGLAGPVGVIDIDPGQHICGLIGPAPCGERDSVEIVPHHVALHDEVGLDAQTRPASELGAALRPEVRAPRPPTGGFGAVGEALPRSRRVSRAASAAERWPDAGDPTVARLERLDDLGIALGQIGQHMIVVEKLGDGRTTQQPIRPRAPCWAPGAAVGRRTRAPARDSAGLSRDLAIISDTRPG